MGRVGSTEVDQRTRRRRAPGERSRRRVLDRAVQLATVEGLDGLSIGRLAEATGMAKSSVYALFGSKEELQLATIDAAGTAFTAEVVAPASASTPGRARLLALCDGFLAHVERRVLPGGCFFVATSAELGARPGPVHDRVAEFQARWRDLLTQAAREAQEQGELSTDTDPHQLAFELGVILAGTNLAAILQDDNAPIARAAEAVRRRIGSRA